MSTTIARTTANRTRVMRAAWRRAAATDAGVVARLVVESPPEVATMEAHELVRWVPGVGRRRVIIMLRRAGVHPLALVGELTERQRGLLAVEFERRSRG